MTGDDILLFSYDQGGNVVSVNYNGTEYYYLRNGQNDIVALIDDTGAKVTEYVYNSWGEVISLTGPAATTIGTLNPFRYRGYVYDEETQLYYLQSRYYDPEVCRFLSSDVLLSTGQGVLGCNAFVYCLNSPMLFYDSHGYKSVAIEFLITWLNGDGSAKEYGEETEVAKIVKESSKMDELVNNAINNCSNGSYTISGSAAFDVEDDFDLYLGMQRFKYSITVTEEIRTKGFWFFKRKQKCYVADVVISDTYDFDAYRTWDSFGNIMNNVAFYLHEEGGIGNDYDITISYSYNTKWETFK